ncbi:MAG: IMP dehydrogenase [Candidatus Sungbacteria bacterium]|nr:IMP dehydrogenase [Candidatus Sungbacteria bacterium]
MEDEVLELNDNAFKATAMPKPDIHSLVNSYLIQKGLPQDIAVTFDDVTILDFKSDIPSRSSIIDTRSHLARDIFLSTPLVSANMDTITESRMAIALARLGGLGFIHQFLPIEKRVEEVKKVKRADSGIIENPLNINPEATLREAKEIMDSMQVSGLLVIDPSSEKLIGIITSRDIRFESLLEKRVAEVMTHAPLITAPRGTTLEQARLILKKNKIEKLPLVDENARVAGLIAAKDLLKIEQFPQASRDAKGHLMVGATVGIGKSFSKEAEELVRAGADVILIDTARGFSTRLEDAIKNLRATLGDIPIVAGNIDTPEGALMLIESGADGIKVGIGPGAVCKTREGPGVGTPQITAVAECVAVAQKYGIPVIADGGIRGGAHFCKALAAGASSVMIGWMLAGTDETPGQPFYEDGEKWKIYRGSASLEFQLSRLDREESERIRASEGVPSRVRYKGEVSAVVHELMSYLRSSMSYVGAWTLEEYRQKAKFRRQTTSGYEEGKPYG